MELNSRRPRGQYADGRRTFILRNSAFLLRNSALIRSRIRFCVLLRSFCAFCGTSNLCEMYTLLLGDYRELHRLSTEYARLWGKFLRITTSFAAGLNPLDLHALSTPPAFTLS